MASRPKKIPGVRLCIVRHADGVTAYGNRQAFRALKEQMEWIEQSPADEEYELQVLTTFQDDECIFEGRLPLNAWTVPVGAGASAAVPPGLEGFELTFKLVGEAALDQLAERQGEGVVPAASELREG